MKVQRPLVQRLWRRMLAAVLTGPLFAPLLLAGRTLRPVLPARLAARIPAGRAAGELPARSHSQRMLLLTGCVQPALAPNINAAAARVLDRLGIELVVERDAGCCGAIRHHLDDQGGALGQARRNIDAWWPQVEQGAEAILVTASGCGTMLREYGHLLRDDARYSEKAARISALARDPAEVLSARAEQLAAQLAMAPTQRIAFQSPCSLQHGLNIRGTVETLLGRLGAEVVPVVDAHLCCGSAGTYSLLQPKIAEQLGRAKAAALTASRPEAILSANIGCITQLGAYVDVPVQHWIEWLDARLSAGAVR